MDKGVLSQKIEEMETSLEDMKKELKEAESKIPTTEFGSSQMNGKAKIYEKAHLYGDASMYEEAKMYGNISVGKNTKSLEKPLYGQTEQE